MVRRSPFGVACAVVAFALAASAHGDYLSSYKKLVAGGPAEQAIGVAIDALQAGDLKRTEVASLKALALAPDEPHALALLAEVEMRQGHPANARKYPQTAVAEEAMGRYLDEIGSIPRRSRHSKRRSCWTPSGRRRKYRWETSIWRGASLRQH